MTGRTVALKAASENYRLNKGRQTTARGAHCSDPPHCATNEPPLCTVVDGI